MITTDELIFFNLWPQLVPIYEALREKLLAVYPEVKIKVSKSQISFYNRHMFAMASLPVKRRKGWPKEFLMVSFGLARQEVSPRVAVSVEAYPGWWTHHVLVQTGEEIDSELLDWIEEAYQFSLAKR